GVGDLGSDSYRTRAHMAVGPLSWAFPTHTSRPAGRVGWDGGRLRVTWQACRLVPWCLRRSHRGPRGAEDTERGTDRPATLHFPVSGTADNSTHDDHRGKGST